MLTQDQILDLIISEDENLTLPADVRENDDFLEYKKIWDLCDVLAETERKPDLVDAWSLINNEMQSVEVEAQKPVIPAARSTGRVVLLRSERWALAASFLLVMGAALYLLRPHNPYTSEVAAGAIELPDGSSVTLSAGSQIKYLKEEAFLAEGDRVVYLEGEAVFDVVADASKPFKVVTNGTSVDVLGTIFRYKSDGDFSESENIEGQVNFSVNEDPTVSQVLNPGDIASYDGDGIKFTPAPLPPPPPPPTPRNKVQILDLIDILTDRYPKRLEVASYMPRNNRVVEVDLRGDLGLILEDLASNGNLQIDSRKVSEHGHFVLSRLFGLDGDLLHDYTFEHYISGLPFKEF